jgi:hypothetical protein
MGKRARGRRFKRAFFLLKKKEASGRKKTQNSQLMKVLSGPFFILHMLKKQKFFGILKKQSFLGFQKQEFLRMPKTVRFCAGL